MVFLSVVRYAVLRDGGDIAFICGCLRGCGLTSGSFYSDVASGKGELCTRDRDFNLVFSLTFIIVNTCARRKQNEHVELETAVVKTPGREMRKADDGCMTGCHNDVKTKRRRRRRRRMMKIHPSTSSSPTLFILQGGCRDAH